MDAKPALCHEPPLHVRPGTMTLGVRVDEIGGTEAATGVVRAVHAGVLDVEGRAQASQPALDLPPGSGILSGDAGAHVMAVGGEGAAHHKDNVLVGDDFSQTRLDDIEDLLRRERGITADEPAGEAPEDVEEPGLDEAAAADPGAGDESRAAEWT